MTTKLCKMCNEIKPVEAFSLVGKIACFKASKTPKYSAYCKPCNCVRQREWYQNHKGYSGTGKQRAIPKEDALVMSAIRWRITNARARKDDVTITAEQGYELFIKQHRRCALSGVELSTDKFSPNVISIDQIEAGKGYTAENVQWLAWSVNRAKGDLPLKTFYEMCDLVVKQKEQRLSKGPSGTE